MAWLLTAAISAMAVFAPAPVSAQTFEEALKNGTTTLQFRPKFDYADVSGNDADAAVQVTAMTRLGYRTGQFADTNVFLQFQDVTAWVRDYAPLDTDYETINDPESTSVHQFYAEFSGVPATKVRLGRQEAVLENNRLLSPSPWRQQGQSLDAITLTNKGIEAWTFNVIVADRVLTSSAVISDLDHFAVLGAEHRGIPDTVLFAHAIFLDSPGGEPTDRDSATYGVRATGDYESAEFAADYNTQGKYADSEQGGGDMINAYVAAKFNPFRIGLGYAQLAGASGSDHAFDTLLGTAHIFQGYADVFAVTNGGGLTEGMKESYLMFIGVHDELRWELSYHDFRQETRDEAYGTEVDARLAYKFSENLDSLLELGQYQADSENTSEFGTADKSTYTLRFNYMF